MNSYGAKQFGIFRIILGVYLTVHFLMLIPFAADTFSNQGQLPQANLNLTYGFFPNILNTLDSPVQVEIFLGVLTMLSLAFTLGLNRRLMALLLWYGWAALFNRNNLISNPGIPFVGFLLLLTVFVPATEAFSLRERRENEEFKISPVLYYGAWLLMATGYMVSGLDKLNSPSWLNGDAIPLVLDLPLARDWFLRDLVAGLPTPVLRAHTWGVLALEIGFPLLALWRRTRFLAWLLMTGMHCGILLMVDFADLTLGMLMIHVFVFDARWLGRGFMAKIAARLPRARLATESPGRT